MILTPGVAMNILDENQIQQLQEIAKSISDPNKQPTSDEVEKAIKILANNQTLKSIVNKEYVHELIRQAEKTLSPKALVLFLNFINAYTTELISKEFVHKVTKDGYDYYGMLQRLFDTLSRFNKKQQDYIVLKSIDVAAQLNSNMVMKILSDMTTFRANIVSSLLDLLRLIEPVFVRVCQEMANGIITNEQIDEFLVQHNIQLAALMMETDKILEEMEKNKNSSTEQKDTSNQSQEDKS